MASKIELFEIKGQAILAAWNSSPAGGKVAKCSRLSGRSGRGRWIRRLTGVRSTGFSSK
jgi:hypothetical protein